MVLCVGGASAYAQVDKSSGAPPRTHLELPRNAFDLTPAPSELQVPAAWRDVERDTGAGFHPSATVVGARPAATLMVKQLAGALAQERAIDEGHGDPSITMAREPGAELRRRMEEEPVEWMRTDVEVVVGKSGELESIVVATPSGKRELDEEAVRAVRRAVTRLRPRGKSGATVRFSCEAGVVATPPILGLAQGDPRGQGVTAAMRIHFDETTKKVEPLIPFVRRVVTRIRISDYAESK